MCVCVYVCMCECLYCNIFFVFTIIIKIIMKIVIIIIMITPYEFFATALPNFLLLESESHQVFLGLQDASENSG